MKVSYYELLGMIKENRQPEKIVYNDTVYIWDSVNYLSKTNYCVTNRMNESEMFDEEITILEPKKIIEENKEIEEIVIYQYDKKLITNADMLYYADFGKSDVLLATKINELIRKVNKLKKGGK